MSCVCTGATHDRSTALHRNLALQHDAVGLVGLDKALTQREAFGSFGFLRSLLLTSSLGCCSLLTDLLLPAYVIHARAARVPFSFKTSCLNLALTLGFGCCFDPRHLLGSYPLVFDTFTLLVCTSALVIRRTLPLELRQAFILRSLGFELVFLSVSLLDIIARLLSWLWHR